MSLKDAAQTFAACFAATLVLTGCGRDTETAPVDQPLPADAAHQPRWVEIIGEGGTALSLLGEGDRQLAHLACLDTPARIVVIGRTFQKVSGETQLTLTLGSNAFALTADLADQAPGVTAAGALTTPILDALPGAPTVSVAYAGQQAGPYDAPTTDVMNRFAASCSALAQMAAPAAE